MIIYCNTVKRRKRQQQIKRIRKKNENNNKQPLNELSRWFAEISKRYQRQFKYTTSSRFKSATYIMSDHRKKQ